MEQTSFPDPRQTSEAFAEEEEEEQSVASFRRQPMADDGSERSGVSSDEVGNDYNFQNL